MLPIRDDHPLRELFAGVVENTFCSEVGLCEPRLTEYLSGLMLEFIHVDRLAVIQNAHGKRPEQIAAMLAVTCDDQPHSAKQRDCLMYRHLGDYSLFWSGLYPECLKRACSKPTDLLTDYVEQGKHSYAAAARLCSGDTPPSSSLLQSLSEEFEACAYGLGLVRQHWEETRPRPHRPNTSPPDLIL